MQQTIEAFAPRWMRDFIPDEMRIRIELFNTFRKIAENYWFDPYETPVVESLWLLKRKAWEEIEEQIYSFKDKSDRELALRPELTPGLVRLLWNKIWTMQLPVKWYSIWQCFRYERMVKWRKREHYQLNMDVVWSKSSIVEAELILAWIDILTSFGLNENDVCVYIWHRQVLWELLKQCWINEEMLHEIFIIIDKRWKISDLEMAQMLKSINIGQEQVDKIFKILSIKKIREIEEFLNKNDNENQDEINKLMNIFNLIEESGKWWFISLDLSIVRWLDYYTWVVFECFDRNKEFRAIFWGGRYDKLFENMWFTSVPAAGFWIWDVVIIELLKSKGKDIKPSKSVDYVVWYVNSKLATVAFWLTRNLRAMWFTANLIPDERKMWKILQLANSVKAQHAVVLDTRETEEWKVLVKKLSTWEQKKLTLIPDENWKS